MSEGDRSVVDTMSKTEHSVNSTSRSNAGEPQIVADANLKVNANTTCLWALAMTAVLGGDFYAWNLGFRYGVGPFAVSTVLVTIVFVTLVYCVSELSSALPFSGGCYGFVRATLGKNLGLLTGLAESMGYILSVAATMMYVSTIITYSTGLSPYWEILWVFICYVIAVSLHVAGGLIMYRSMIFLTIMQLLILFLYAIAGMKYGDFSNKCTLLPANQDGYGKWWADNYESVFYTMPYAVWWYLGVEIVPFAAEETLDAKRAVPKASLLSMLNLFITMLIAFFSGCTLGPDMMTLTEEMTPLSIGFDYLFGGPGFDKRYLNLLSIVGVFCSGYGIMFAYGRQMYSMARSGLFPQIFTKTYADRGTPAASLILSSLIGYAFAVIARLTDYDLVSNVMFSLGMIGSMVTYVSIFVAFIIIRVKFYMIPRPFQSALGMPGAIIGLICGMVMVIGMLGWSKYTLHGLVGLVAWFIVGVSYYVFIGRKHVVLSPEEQFALFLIYSIRFVRNKNRDATTKKKKYEAEDAAERSKRRNNKRQGTFTSRSSAPAYVRTASATDTVRVHPLGPVRTSVKKSSAAETAPTSTSAQQAWEQDTSASAQPRRQGVKSTADPETDMSVTDAHA